MNLLELEPMKSDGGDCFDDVIVTIDGWHRRGYELMYADAVKFYFDPNPSEPTVGARMKFSNNFVELLQTYYGYDIQIHNTISPTEGLAIIKEHLARGNPLGLIIDTFYSDWDPGYRTRHYLLHVMLVTGIDSETGDLFCTDPFYLKKNMRLPHEHFKAGFIGCMTMEPSGPVMLNTELVLASVRTKLQEYLDVTPQHLHTWAEAMMSVRFGEEAENAASVTDSLFYKNINALVTGRFNYARMLDYLAHRYTLANLHSFSQEMKQVAYQWSTVRGMTAKLIFIPSSHWDDKLMENLAGKIKANAVAETNLIERLAAELEPTAPVSVPSPSLNRSDSHLGKAIEHIEHVPLRHLFDNRAFDNDSGTANFDGDGHLYAGTGIPEGQKLCVEDISFDFPAPLHEPFDNLSCMGQSVTLQPGQYQGFMVLGSSQFGSCLDTVTVEYNDGTADKVMLGFSDWWTPMNVNGEVVALQTSMLNRKDDYLPDHVYLYATKAALNNAKTVERLVLPIAPNLRVFAVSLWK